MATPIKTFRIIATFRKHIMVEHPTGWGFLRFSLWDDVTDVDGYKYPAFPDGDAKCNTNMIMKGLAPRYGERFIIEFKRVGRNFSFEFPIKFIGVNTNRKMKYDYKTHRMINIP